MYKLDDVVGMRLESIPKHPPNFAEIVKVFPLVEHKKGILYSWGDTIYNPDNVIIPLWLLAHECVHSAQHKDIGSPDLWWTLYLTEPKFRLREETQAHEVELEAYNKQHNRAMRKSYLHSCAERLSGSLYGNIIRPRDARRILRESVDAAS